MARRNEELPNSQALADDFSGVLRKKHASCDGFVGGGGLRRVPDDGENSL
jgi:hypothetical protein